MSFIVAIDGFTGVGKGTLAKAISEKYNLVNMDTGAIYRSVTLFFQRKNIKSNEVEKIVAELKNIKIDFIDGKIHLNGEDVSREIRTKEVDVEVPLFSKVPEIRAEFLPIQRKIAEKNDVVLDGRDIGTVVFPNADVKIFLDADLEVRAERRYKQNLEKGISITFEECKENIRARDELDVNKEISPLKKADDAISIDTTNLTIEEVVEIVSKHIEKKKKLNKIVENAYKECNNKFLTGFVRRLYKMFFGILCKIFYRPKFKNIENFYNEKGPIILCGNHIHAMDSFPLVLCTKRKIRFIAKIELWTETGPALRLYGKIFKYIPINRETSDIHSIKISIKALKNGEILGIFPEGTRNKKEGEKPKNGAVFLANKTNAKLVPVGINGEFKPFSKSVYSFGKAIDLNTYDKTKENWLEKATEDIMNQIEELSKN